MEPKIGLALPAGVDKEGRALVSEGSDQIEKLIKIGVSPGDNDNPFLGEVGIPEKIIFQRDLSVTRGFVERQVRLLFQGLQRESRAVLDKSSPFKWDKGEDGNPTLTVNYFDLEGQRPSQITLPMKGL